MSYVQQVPRGEIAYIRRQEQMLEQYGQFAFGGLGVVLLAGVGGVIYWIVTKTILTGESFWGGILLIAFIVFAVLALAYVVLRESLNEKKQKINPQLLEAEPEPPSTVRQISDVHFQPAVSVVEDTTDLLPIKNKTREFQ